MCVPELRRSSEDTESTRTMQVAILQGGDRKNTRLLDAAIAADEGLKPFDESVKDLLDAIELIERKAWDKASGWGDQLKHIASKPNVYVFVLLGPESRGDNDGDSSPDVVDESPVVVAYAIVAVNALHSQLQKLFTLSAWRGRGWATRLVRIVCRCVRTLKGRGHEVTLFVASGNVAAISVYRRCGFVQESVAKDYYRLGSDALRMRHVLA